MSDNFEFLAKRIIEENQYFSLSTCTNNIPWSCTLTYVYDKNLHFYFMSDPNSKHIKQITVNPEVSVTIYDSTQKWGYGLGLQIQGTVQKIPLLELPAISKLFFSRDYPFGGKPKIGNVFKKAIDAKLYYFYRLTHSEIWVTDPEADVDGRVLVKLTVPLRQSN